MTLKKRKKTGAKKPNARGVSKTRKKVLSTVERFALAQPVLNSVLKAHYEAHFQREKTAIAEAKLYERQEREAILEEEIQFMKNIIEPARLDGETDENYARRCIQIAKDYGLELDYHYERIAALTGLRPGKIYQMWLSPGALVA